MRSSRRRGIDSRACAHDYGSVPHRDFWPKNREQVRRLVAVLVWEIEDSDDGDRDELLEDFLRAAWPTAQALYH